MHALDYRPRFVSSCSGNVTLRIGGHRLKDIAMPPVAFAPHELAL
jgi:hypothetical protein